MISINAKTKRSWCHPLSKGWPDDELGKRACIGKLVGSDTWGENHRWKCSIEGITTRSLLKNSDFIKSVTFKIPFSISLEIKSNLLKV